MIHPHMTHISIRERKKGHMKLRSVIILGIAWGLIVVGFQWITANRFQTQPPDQALDWTPSETSADSHVNRPYLLDPVMNASVAWDSEYYLSIAIAGYDDPLISKVYDNDRAISKSYAFLPFYPVLIKIVALPFNLFMRPIAAAALAGTIVSILGAIAAACALFLLVKGNGENRSGFKTAFYFLIFPSSFFLAQVYTEGLFLGLVFCTFALLKYKKLGWAALLAVLAVWTKVVGVCLVVPLVWSWFELKEKKTDLRTILNLLYSLAPLAAFILWYLSPLGQNFNSVEALFFNRKPLNLVSSFNSWTNAFMLLFTGGAQTRAYYLIEWSAIIYGIAACILMMKKTPALSVFGLLVIVLSLTSGASQGMHRYILAAPPVFMLLGLRGEKSETFDRSWTIASVLLFGMLASCFTLNMWVG
jgi:hypothetical protein